MKQEKLLSILFLLLVFFELDAQLINVTYDENNNCVTAQFDECSSFITGNITASKSCECLKNIKNTECYDECLKYYCGFDLDIECEQCRFRCKLEECGITHFQPRCKPCRIVYRLIADFAPIPFDPRFHAGNRFVSTIFTSGGNDDGTGCTTFSSECENICDSSCDKYQPIEFECFELPSNWQEISSGNNI